MDLEKAMMLANARGAAISVNQHLGSDTGPSVYDHQTEKDLYYSCYLPGMKAYFKTLMKKKDQKLL